MRLFVPLTRDELDRLSDLARQERRRPQEQAAVLLSRALDDRDTRNRETLPPPFSPHNQYDAAPATMAVAPVEVRP